MRAICLYLHIHQPNRYRKYSAFEIGNNSDYFNAGFNDAESNERIFKKVAKKSYHPMLDLIEKNIKKFPNFKLSLSITGTWLDQAEKWDPSLIEQIKKNECSKLSLSGTPLNNSLSLIEDQNAINLKNLQNIGKNLRPKLIYTREKYRHYSILSQEYSETQNSPTITT